VPNDQQVADKPAHDKPAHNGSGDPKESKQQEQKETPPQPKEPLKVRARRYVRLHPGRIWVGAVALILLAVGAVFLWLYLSSYESTDDAQVDGHIDLISPRIGGTVVGVYVDNDQFVQPGQVMVDLDPRDYKAALRQATGEHAQAMAQLRAENPSVPITVTTNQTTISTGEADVVVAEKMVAAAQQEYEAKLADLRNTEAQSSKAQRDVDRFRPLAAKEEVSRQQFDLVTATAESQAASVDAAQAAVKSALQALDERRAQLLQARTRLQAANENAPRETSVRQATVASREASVISAEAALEQARLNLLYEDRGAGRGRGH
jgi:membrane fusion protein (multidrug efflux system)